MRKNMKRIFIVAGIVYLFTAAGCKKGYLDINTNPNNPADVTPELVLPSTLNSSASRLINSYTFISGWMGQWAVSGSYAPSTTNFTTYRQTTDFGGGLWATIYNNLEDCYYVETKGAEQGKPFYQGAAKIIKSHEFQQLVDMFGNVPYFNSLKGTANLQPVYDDAQAIYEDLIVQIDSGINLIKSSAGAGVPGSSDIMFAGDVTSWVKFANTLKLRILMRQTSISGRDGYINSQIAAIVGEGSGFLTEDADVNPGYINTSGKMNPFYSLNYNTSGTYINDFWRANQFGLDFYEKNDDSRAHLVYGPTPGDATVYQGNYIGQTDGHVGSASSVFGPGVLKSVSQSAVMISAAESYFLQAEANLRGWSTGTGSAKDLYHAGIEASFAYLGADGADTYYSQVGNSNVYWDDTKSFDYKLNLIIAQKWAAENNVTPFETWADYRRLPNVSFNKSIPLSESPYREGNVPLRILYPTSEYATNEVNVPEQDAQAHHTSKIFWMP
jgi:hypothetical protein